MYRANVFVVSPMLQSSLGQAQFVSGMEKILGPLVLIHLRDRDDLHKQKVIENITKEVFICYANLLNSNSFMHHFISDELM